MQLGCGTVCSLGFLYWSFGFGLFCFIPADALASIWHGIDVDEFGEDSLAEPVVEESVDYGAELISWY